MNEDTKCISPEILVSKVTVCMLWPISDYLAAIINVVECACCAYDLRGTSIVSQVECTQLWRNNMRKMETVRNSCSRNCMCTLLPKVYWTLCIKIEIPLLPHAQWHCWCDVSQNSTTFPTLKKITFSIRSYKHSIKPLFFLVLLRYTYYAFWVFFSL